ncbi:unnamed protein product [Dovyalis caffra]|uniref:Chalcone synthase n=1 Tax=Dovyalis caffra TaxID=77055 RepID=A0AAV1S7X2_9ROSI|nr:unnamed protein product [Dovyalis caffra]
MPEQNQNIGSYDAPSLDARQDILVTEVPKIGEEAALKVITEWGQPKSKIKHLIFSSVAGVDMPGPDFQLARLLGLETSIKRVTLYHQGCYIDGAAIRIAKDFAESTLALAFLVVCSNITIGKAIMGASALIIGADPHTSVERPLFQIYKIRGKSVEKRKTSAGEGVYWGVLVGLGAGLTVDTVVMQSVSMVNAK